MITANYRARCRSDLIANSIAQSPVLQSEALDYTFQSCGEHVEIAGGWRAKGIRTPPKIATRPAVFIIVP